MTLSKIIQKKRKEFEKELVDRLYKSFPRFWGDREVYLIADIKEFISSAIKKAVKEMARKVDIEFQEPTEGAGKDDAIFIDGCNHIIKHLKARINNFIKRP